MASLFEKDIQFLKGVGSKRKVLFEKLNVPTIGALLRFYPRTYEDWSKLTSVKSAPIGTPCCIKAVVTSPVYENLIRRGMSLYKVRVCDGETHLNITFFNNRFVKNKLKLGEEFLFYGVVKPNFSLYEMTSPNFMSVNDCLALRPIYHQTQGLTSKQVETSVKNALDLLPEVVKDPIPAEIRKKFDLCDLRFAIENIHFPINEKSLNSAKKRLTFEELLLLQLGLSQIKENNLKENQFKIKQNLSDEFWRLLPFEPTSAQIRTVNECISDMMSETSMHRLIQGDVGSGKTAVAAALCYSAIKFGMQAAIMVPTEILAEQHFNFFSRILGTTGIRVEILTGSTPKTKKRRIKDYLEVNAIDLVIGTHALLSDDVYFSNLGLIITDEQHRFGVSQRAKLVSKGHEPHVVVMSATPIPRTLAMIIYGDLDISVLDEMPPGRQKIDTFCISGEKRLRAYNFIKNLIDEGRQAYIVCPLIDESDSNLLSAQEYAQKLQNEFFKNYKIGLLHGKMSAREKNYIMNAFAAHEIDILVSTTVIEVGVNVPNSVVMLIENAERFGLSQLHQLRGRVGRGEHKSYCILISDNKNEETLRRLHTVCKTNDGIKIADEDLKTRGPGDFIGSRQHGLPDLHISGLIKDVNVLNDSKRAALAILNEHPLLKLEKNRVLKAEITRLFGKIERGFSF